ncbi:MAG: hypothetical protein K6T83_09930 [Alicyclobacillus sp.]|nr:hypothetical protein [Alicyclobacillus sp.]
MNSLVRTWIPERPLQSGLKDEMGMLRVNDNTVRGFVHVDDEVNFLLVFENGAIGSIEASRNAYGRNNYIYIEIHGSLGSIVFNYERWIEIDSVG